MTTQAGALAATNGDKQLVARFFETFSTGNVANILAMLDDKATWWVSGKIEGLSDTYDKARLGALLSGVTEAYKGGALRITPTSMIAEGGKVAVEATSYAELLNGRVYNNAYHFLVEVKDGKILRVREYMDTLHAKQVFID